MSSGASEHMRALSVAGSGLRDPVPEPGDGVGAGTRGTRPGTRIPNPRRPDPIRTPTSLAPRIHSCRLIDVQVALPALFRLLGDDVRLRLLRVLHAERLNVTELTCILGIAQSGVSRHLGLLKDAGLVSEQREGGLHLLPPGAGADRRPERLRALWRRCSRRTSSRPRRTDAGRADDVRLAEVRRLRKENFEAHAGPDTQARQLVPGRSWAAWARALGHLLPPLKVADLGCGEGYLTIEASRWASRVLAVDRSTTC